MPKADKPEPTTEASQRDGAFFFYHCPHGASNTPCPWHFKETDPVMPDNWYETYESPGPPGITDEASIQGGDVV